MLETLPSWIKFLKWHHLINDQQASIVNKELIKLCKIAVKIFEEHHEDPTLFNNLQSIVASNTLGF